jgi:hypothetical protein
MRTQRAGSYRESLARHCPNEALHLGFAVVVVHAGADERVQAAGGQVERGHARRTGQVDVDVHRAQPLARLARRLAVLEKGDDPALLDAEIVHAHAEPLRELSPQQRTERFDPCLDRVDAYPECITGGDADADLAGDEPLPVFEPARIVAGEVGVGVDP